MSVKLPKKKKKKKRKRKTKLTGHMMEAIGREFVMVAFEWKHVLQKKCMVGSPRHGTIKLKQK